MDNEQQHTNKVPWLEPYQYKPGDSGNPHGRPVGRGITAELNKLINKPGIAEQLAQAVVDLAKDKHSRYQLAALSLALDRTDGKVKDVLAIEDDVSKLTLVALLKMVETKQPVETKQIGEGDVQRQTDTEGSSQESSGEA